MAVVTTAQTENRSNNTAGRSTWRYRCLNSSGQPQPNFNPFLAISPKSHQHIRTRWLSAPRQTRCSRKYDVSGPVISRNDGAPLVHWHHPSPAGQMGGTAPIPKRAAVLYLISPMNRCLVTPVISCPARIGDKSGYRPNIRFGSMRFNTIRASSRRLSSEPGQPRQAPLDLGLHLPQNVLSSLSTTVWSLVTEVHMGITARTQSPDSGLGPRGFVIRTHPHRMRPMPRKAIHMCLNALTNISFKVSSYSVGEGSPTAIRKFSL
ncbi:hypothetical protein B0J17DRAFT_413773 [Rhizoctonia solani]|nr:hypothetical protein B0J17DRAFT_413773 [Rhizoctonia solani]